MLPEWITQLDNYKARFVSDPDVFYPKILDELEGRVFFLFGNKDDAIVFEGDIDQYWLEVAHNVMKLDFSRAIKQANVDPSVAPVNIVRGGEGYKDRWAQKNYKPGRLGYLKKKHGDDAWKQVAKETRYIYQELRG